MQTVKTLLLIVALIVVCTFLSRLAADAYWLGIHIHRSVEFGRVCDSVGRFLLFPGRFVLLGLAGPESEPVFGLRELAQANGLVAAIILYAILRGRLLGPDTKA